MSGFYKLKGGLNHTKKLDESTQEELIEIIQVMEQGNFKSMSESVADELRSEITDIANDLERLSDRLVDVDKSFNKNKHLLTIFSL